MAPDGIRQEVHLLAVAISAIGDITLLTVLVPGLAVHVDLLSVNLLTYILMYVLQF